MDPVLQSRAVTRRRRRWYRRYRSHHRRHHLPRRCHLQSTRLWHRLHQVQHRSPAQDDSSLLSRPRVLRSSPRCRFRRLLPPHSRLAGLQAPIGRPPSKKRASCRTPGDAEQMTTPIHPLNRVLWTPGDAERTNLWPPRVLETPFRGRTSCDGLSSQADVSFADSRKERDDIVSQVLSFVCFSVYLLYLSAIRRSSDVHESRVKLAGTGEVQRLSGAL